MKRNGLVPWTRGTWRLLVVAFASGFGLAAGTAGEIHAVPVEGTPVQAQLTEACPGGTCEIPEKVCDLGTAPAQSQQCCAGQTCKTKGNSCIGLSPFQLPSAGYVQCIDCKTVATFDQVEAVSIP